MYKVKNPTEADISIQYRGLPYSIKAGETAVLENEVALHWKGIHAFIEVSDVDLAEAKVEAKPKVDVVSAEADGQAEVTEEIKEEEEVKAPVKKGKK